MKNNVTDPKKRLNILRERYKTKYITPLTSFFSNPPQMFDENQVRLKRQIDKSLEELETSELCPLCKGQGTILQKIDHVLDKSKSWINPYQSPVVDQREVSVDLCSKCNGNGLIFPLKSITGQSVSGDRINDLQCPSCGNSLIFDATFAGGSFFQDKTAEEYLEAKCSCSKRVYRLIPTMFKFECLVE